MTVDEVVRALAEAPRLLLMSDYDGTLAAIVTDPNGALPDPEALTALEDLVSLPDTVVAVVSGRPLAELRRFLDVPELILIGGHGAESDRGTDLDPGRAALLGEVVAGLEEIAGEAEGAWVEVKPTSAVLHVRQVVSGSGRLVAMALEGPGRLGGARSFTGKEVVEVSVSERDKGAAVRDLRTAHPGGLACFVGDDRTDEDAFAALTPPDIGVKVGEGDTVAEVLLPGQEDVAGFLASVAQHRRARLTR